MRSRSMPPVGNRRPDNAMYDAIATWLETLIMLRRPRESRPARGLHRLNRTEYANAIRDLTGIEIDSASMLAGSAGSRHSCH